MTRNIIIATFILAAAAVSPLSAQNRAETQMLLELRTLQEQVQRLQLALNQMTERVKANETQVETRANDMRKGFADQKLLIDSITQGLRTLTERENESGVKIALLSQEMKAIRDGLTMQQTMLNEIVGLLQPAATAAAATTGGTGVVDPTAPPTTGATPPRPGGGIPPSPGEYYDRARNYYFSNQYDLAIEALTDAIKRFPDAPQAARAQMLIGESYYKSGKYKEALTAFTATLTNYKDPDVLPDAMYRQGMAYEALGQIAQARKSYQQVITTYKDSTSAILAAEGLKRLK
jgi:tol-pal system protein YbgF